LLRGRRKGGPVQAPEHEASCDPKAFLERDQLWRSDASPVIDRQLGNSGLVQARGAEQVGLEIQPSGNQRHLPERVRLEAPHARADVTHRDAEKDARQDTQEAIANRIQWRHSPFRHLSAEPRAEDHIVPGGEGIEEAMGYRFQFVTLAEFHTLNLSIFQLAQAYNARGMTAYAELQGQEFAAREKRYRAVEHQAFVGTEYFDQVGEVISGGTSSTLAMEGSTEREQITKTATTHRPKAS